MCGQMPAACATDTTHAEHGARALVLPTGCYAYTKTTAFDHTLGVRFDYFAQVGGVAPSDVWVGARGPDGRVERVFSENIGAGSSSWIEAPSEGVLRTAELTTLTLYVFNANGSLDAPKAPNIPLYVDDIIAVQDVANPPPVVGSLLRAEHDEHFALAPGSSDLSLWLPMPMDYGSQVPLYLELSVNPPSVLDHVSYVTEDEHNWGAVLHFPSNAHASDVTLHWDAVALTRRVADAEAKDVYPAVTPPDRWLPPSPLADSTYPGIATTTQGLATPTATPLDAMTAILGWTSTNIDGAGVPASLDATTVYNTRVSSCTGYANLASAMGRAAGVPTRAIDNILVGESQQMHSINEFFLGPDLGWRRVEPQSKSPTLPEDYGFLIRVVVPSDEASLQSAAAAMPGVPDREFTTPLTSPERYTYTLPAKRHFMDCTECLNAAHPQAELNGTADDAKAVFDEARSLWQTDINAYTAGGVSSARIAARRKLLDARSLDDVKAVLDALP